MPDNLRPGGQLPKINRSYAEMAAHYGRLIDPRGRSSPATNLRLHTAPLRVGL